MTRSIFRGSGPTPPFAVGMLDAAQKEAARSGYLLSIVQLDEGGSAEAQWDAIDLLRQQQVTGPVYATMYHRVLTPPPRFAGRSGR